MKGETGNQWALRDAIRSLSGNLHSIHYILQFCSLLAHVGLYFPTTMKLSMATWLALTNKIEHKRHALLQDRIILFPVQTLHIVSLRFPQYPVISRGQELLQSASLTGDDVKQNPYVANVATREINLYYLGPLRFETCKHIT